MIGGSPANGGRLSKAGTGRNGPCGRRDVAERSATVIVVQPDPDAARRYAAWLQREGHRVIRCPTPRPPHYACYMLETARCPLAEAADLIVYDPWLACDEGEPDATELVRALRAR